VTDVCWGVFRERAHSPGREGDDAEILRLTAKRLEEVGFAVTLIEPADLPGEWDRPRGVFLMCERLEALGSLRRLEQEGVIHVNSPVAVLNTYRDRMIAQLAEAGVRFVQSRLVATGAAAAPPASPVWVKRADVHNTQDGDVVFAASPAEYRSALTGLAARGIERAVVQPHVAGDLVKFYGVGRSASPDGGPPWFRWFYHKGQTLGGHPFDPAGLARLARLAALALGLEVYGGDAIVPEEGGPLLLDLNAWPSFALFRDEAAQVIAAHLASRFAETRR
jgi:hypothetical protein